MIVAEIPAEKDGTEPARAGTAVVEFAQVRGRTVLARSRATSPLRIMAPRNRAGGRAAWVFTSTFGGGLLPGDQLAIDLTLQPHTTAYMSSQSSTKIYQSDGERVASQELQATLHEGALLVLTPDPVVCFAEARYRQTQRFAMPASGGLVLLDAFTSGRHAPPRSERWQLHSLQARNEITLEGKRVLTDVLHLNEEDGPLAGKFRMGVFNCFATLVIVGERVAAQGKEVMRAIGAMPVGRGDSPLVAASPLADGVIVRLAAGSSEQAMQFLHGHMQWLGELLGEHPWRRKW